MTQSALRRRSTGRPRVDRAARPRRSTARTQRSAYLLLSPWMVGVALLTIGPMVASLWLSFTDYDLFDPPHWVGLRNYATMFQHDPRFWHASWVTLRYVVFSVPLKLGLALAVALAVNRARRGLGFYRAAFYGPSLLGATVSLAVVWRAMFESHGVVDRVLAAFGLRTGGWIDQPQYALFALVALAVWQFGTPMVIFLAGLKQVPAELYDAAATDGAGRLRTFWSVTLPMLSPVVLFNVVLETIHAFQAFTGSYVVSGGRGGPSDATLFYTLYIYQRGFTDFRMGYAAAMAWILLLVVAAVTALLFRLARSWVFYTGEDRG